MQELLLVTVPAVVAALGTLATAYVSVKVRTIATQTNGRVTYLENEIQLMRHELAALERERDA